MNEGSRKESKKEDIKTTILKLQAIALPKGGKCTPLINIEIKNRFFSAGSFFPIPNNFFKWCMHPCIAACLHL